MDEREFELINIIGAKLGSNQRDLSRQMDLSLGMVNMLIRRLIAKGYIRINQLNKRKVEYILTPQGFTEKMRKTYKYTLKTISSMTLIKEKIRSVVSRLYTEGERNFIVLGKSDFAQLIDIVFKDLGLTGYTLTYVDQIPADQKEGVVLVCKEDIDFEALNQFKAIDMVRELAEDHSFMNNAVLSGASDEKV